MAPLRYAWVVLALVGCYSPSVKECTISCGTAGACPSDTTCMADGFCHSDIGVKCLPLGGDAGGQPDAKGGQPDARPGQQPDARPGEPDARPGNHPDAGGTPDAGGPPCTNELGPVEETDLEDSMYSNLSVSSTGVVHITYLDYNTNVLRYARRGPDQADWSFDDIDLAAAELKGQTLDANGMLHVAFSDDSLILPRLRYARGMLGNWKVETIESEWDVDATIAVDPSTQRIHVAYWALDTNDLYYATRGANDTLWKIAPIDSEGMVGEHPSIGLGALGSVHISYRVGGILNDLGLATLKSPTSSWSKSRPDQSGNVGNYTALAVDPSGGIHIAYSDNTNEQLKYAYLPTSGPNLIIPVESGVGVGRFNSIAVDRQGGVHISYYAFGDRNLRYAVKRSTQSTFNARTLDAVGDVGRQSSIGVDANGIAHISYIDDSNGDLKYARICP